MERKERSSYHISNEFALRHVKVEARIETNRVEGNTSNIHWPFLSVTMKELRFWGLMTMMLPTKSMLPLAFASFSKSGRTGLQIRAISQCHYSMNQRTLRDRVTTTHRSCCAFPAIIHSNFNKTYESGARARRNSVRVIPETGAGWHRGWIAPNAQSTSKSLLEKSSQMECHLNSAPRWRNADIDIPTVAPLRHSKNVLGLSADTWLHPRKMSCFEGPS